MSDADVDVIRWLSSPAAYGEATSHVDVCETHISWVFLTTAFAYKLKKPVRFGFVDFSTAQLRRAACDAEVRLNRRLTHDMYLGALPISRDGDGTLELNGAGVAFDWLVHMRRLPAERTLDRLIRTRHVAAQDIVRLAERLTAFYRRADSLGIPPIEYRTAVEAHVRGNLAELSALSQHFPGGQVRRVHGAQLQWLALCGNVLDARVSDDRIVDGHGDLRPEHICLCEPLQIFDCLEFSADLRRVDIIDELAFLAVECEYLGADSIGRQVLETYQRASGDQASEALLGFYKSYRAAVRAKVTAIRSEQLAGAAGEESRRVAQGYLELADRHAAALTGPIVLLMRGRMGSGKSTLAIALARLFGAELLQTDQLRRELFGASVEPQAYGQGNYVPAQRRRVYAEMLAQAERFLVDGLTVVLAGGFLSADRCAEALSLARRRNAVPLVVICRCPDEISRQRIAQRHVSGKSTSEGRTDLYEPQQSEETPLEAGTPVIEIDTTLPLAVQVKRVLNCLGLSAVRSSQSNGKDGLPC
jgi:aminoglycoside phosphotransferase family enzyme/predicted kinase